MVPSIKVNTSTARKKVRASLLSLTNLNTRATSGRTKYAVTVSICGLMASITMENGTTTRCTARVLSYGKIRRNTKVNS